MNCDEKIHKIMQEEIADRVGYQDKFCELALTRGLQSAESRLHTVLQQARQEEREAMKKKIEMLKAKYTYNGYKGSFEDFYADLLNELNKN